MGFENIKESITNKNNGVKNLRQGLIYNNNKTKTKKKVIEGFQEGNTNKKPFKSATPPTDPWKSSGPYKSEDGTIMRDVGKRKVREVPDPANPGKTKSDYYYDRVRNYRGKFDKMRSKELTSYGSALDSFDENKRKYAEIYTKVANNFSDLTENVSSCLENCKNKAQEIGSQSGNTNGMDNNDYGSKYQTFCEAGCKFKGPVLVTSCKDTWKGLKKKQKDDNNNTYSTNAKCSAFHPTCDKNTNGVMRGQYANSMLSYEDMNGRLLKDACCSCGGGAGGTPAVNYNNIWHKSCDSLERHVCEQDGSCGTSSASFKDICNTAMSKINKPGHIGKLKEIKKNYDKVVTHNNVMKNKAEFLFKKINQYEKQLTKLKNEKNNEEETYEQIMSGYTKARQELLNLMGMKPSANDDLDPTERYTVMMEQAERMKKDWSRDTMVEESVLKRKSEEMQFWMWTILAIVVGWATIINFKKKPA